MDQETLLLEKKGSTEVHQLPQVCSHINTITNQRKNDSWFGSEPATPYFVFTIGLKCSQNLHLSYTINFPYPPPDRIL